MPDRFGKYSYFDTPDGTDGHKKAWYICKYAAKFGFLTGTIDSFIVTAAKTPLGVLTIYAKHLTVAVAAGLAFVSTTYISTDLRKKDDPRNHVVGGLATSAVLGAAAGNRLVFVTLALASAPLLHANKTAMMQGNNLWRIQDEALNIHQEYPSPNWHTVEADRKNVMLRQMYEEKNEEYFNNLQLKKESAV